MKTKKIFTLLFGFIITIIVLIGVGIVLLLQNQNNLAESEKIRHESIVIANELRQSSDDLTNYCRLYVMTGDSAWETKYWKVLQIRNGKHPRPDGRQISLRDSMLRLGFTTHEFDLFSSSETHSNELVWTEKVAFNSLKGIFPDSLGVFSIQDEPNISYAQQIMFDEKYLQAKAKIMQPIDEFINQIEKRTNNTVQNYREIGYILVSLFVVILLAGIIISLIAFLLIKKQLIAQIKADIALRKSNEALQNAKEKAEESEKDYKILTQNIPGMVYRAIKDGSVKIITNSELICGYSSDLFLSVDVKWADLIFSDDREKVFSELQLLIQKPISIMQEYRIKAKDNSIRYVADYKTSLFDEENNFIEIDGIVIDITDRKLAEKALLENKARLQEAQIIGQMGHWDLDLITNKLIWSDEVYRIFDLKPQEFKATYEAFLDGIHPGDREKVNNAYTNSLKNKKPYHIEHRLLLKTGKLKYVVEQCKTEFDKHGKPLRSLGTIQDITERKKAEVELIIAKEKAEENEAKYRKLSNLTFEGIVIHNKGIAIDANQSFIKLLGYSRKELIGKNLIDLIVPERYHPIISKKIKQKYALPYEIEFRKKDGSLFPVELESKNVKPTENNTNRVVAVRDITLRKNAEEKIHKLNKELEARVEKRTKQFEQANENLLIEIEERKRAEESARHSEEYRFSQFISSPVGMVLCKMDGTLVDINPAYAKIIGRTIEETLKLTYWDLTPQKYAEQEETQLQSLEETGSYGPYFKEYIHKEGHLVPVELSGLILELNGERFIWSSVQDITERKQAEEEIKKAKTEAEQANRAKSDFLSRMSHELRTPMNSILGFAQLMDMGELNPVHKKGINHILKAGKHLLDLINEVLDISRIEAGRTPPSLEPVLLQSALTAALDIVRPLATERNIKLELGNSPTNDLFVKADHQKLKQVLLNLINNAIKYNPQDGSVIVSYKLKDHKEGEIPFVHINISDTGEGIARGDIKKLFTPFERIGKNIAEVEGTGLGLSVVKKLVELMNGKVGVESKVGKGSTFWIELPQGEGQVENAKRNGDLAKPGAVQKKHKGTLLYIEDNVSNIELVEHILDAYYPEILLLTEMYGKGAVKHASEYKPDLILLDLNLPDIHGSKVLKLLQSNPETRYIPVVVVSADAMEKQVKKLLKAGAKDYLAKPFDVIQFLQVVDEHMGKSNDKNNLDVDKNM